MEYPRIRDLRESKNKTQQNMADLLHCQREVYRRYETGEREIPVWALEILADFYQTSVDYLLGRTDRSKPYAVSRRRRQKER